MLVEIITIPALVWFAVTFAITPAITLILSRITGKRKPIKPFECVFCMSFWVSLVYFIVVYGFEAAPLACTCAIIGALIDKNV